MSSLKPRCTAMNCFSIPALNLHCTYRLKEKERRGERSGKRKRMREEDVGEEDGRGERNERGE